MPSKHPRAPRLYKTTALPAGRPHAGSIWHRKASCRFCSVSTGHVSSPCARENQRPTRPAGQAQASSSPCARGNQSENAQRLFGWNRPAPAHGGIRIVLANPVTPCRVQPLRAGSHTAGALTQSWRQAPAHGGNTVQPHSCAKRNAHPAPVHRETRPDGRRFGWRGVRPCARGKHDLFLWRRAEGPHPVPAYRGNTMPQDIGESSVGVRPCAQGETRRVSITCSSTPCTYAQGKHARRERATLFPLRHPTPVHRGKHRP